MTGIAAYLRRHRLPLGGIALVSWIANYLHFSAMGLYADDWYYVAFPFLYGLRVWMFNSLANNLRPENFQGRPLQYLLVYSFSAIGAASNSLAADYLIVYILFTIAAFLLFEVLRRRFTDRVAALTALIFVLSPLYTVKQFVSGQFSFEPAFLLVFSAMLLYLGGRRAAAYALAALALLCYESIYFLFLAAPMLKPGPLFKGRAKEWIAHLSTFGAITAVYFLARASTGETRVAGMPHGFTLLADVVRSWLYYMGTSFLTYLLAALRTPEASLEAWIYAAVFFFATSAILLRRPEPPSKSAFSGTLIAFSLLACGYALAFFFEFSPQPHLILTDRASRISVAASVGSSLLLALWIDQLLALKHRIIPVLAAAVLSILFLYSFVIQNDYVEDWHEQRAEIAQMIALTPDATRDSLILIEAQPPDDTLLHPSRRHRGIGFEKTLFEWHFPRVCADMRDCPTIYYIYSPLWRNYLRTSPGGSLAWTQPIIDGHFTPVSGNVRAGRFIVLEREAPGVLRRPNRPIYADGVQIVQIAAPVEKSFWSSISRNHFTDLFLDR